MQEKVNKINLELDNILQEFYTKLNNRKVEHENEIQKYKQQRNSCSSCKFMAEKNGGKAFLCLFGDSREVMWIPEHIFKSGCIEWKEK